jgi:shikimate dehydrogenase
VKETGVRLLSGATQVAGVVGSPVRHSLSPRIHSRWIADAGLDAVYVPFPVAEDGFRRFVEGMRGGAVRGVNVTIPFKEDALALADESDLLSRRSGAANVLIFHDDGRVEARNTDGPGLIEGLVKQVPGLDLTAAPVVVLGAGGAARGAGAALVAAGVPEIRLVNRTWARAAGLAEAFPYTYAFEWAEMARAFAGAGVVVNATAAGLNGRDELSDLPLHALPDEAVVMDMVYKPLETGLLRAARARGLRTVDGLSMLIQQAIPSFEAFYGRPPPAESDVRGLAIEALGQAG